MVERFSRMDEDNLISEVTVEDPTTGSCSRQGRRFRTIYIAYIELSRNSNYNAAAAGISAGGYG